MENDGLPKIPGQRLIGPSWVSCLPLDPLSVAKEEVSQESHIRREIIGQKEQWEQYCFQKAKLLRDIWPQNIYVNGISAWIVTKLRALATSSQTKSLERTVQLQPLTSSSSFYYCSTDERFLLWKLLMASLQKPATLLTCVGERIWLWYVMLDT